VVRRQNSPDRVAYPLSFAPSFFADRILLSSMAIPCRIRWVRAFRDDEIRSVVMEANAVPLPPFRWARAGSAAVGILIWSVWAILTLVAVLYIRQHSRNIPYIDDFSLVPIMAGHEPLTAQWLWSQHNEHRPVVSRLILVGLHRFIASDFRVAQYANAGLLSAMAASMIVFVRRLRGRWSVFDVAIPLSILNIGQAETLMIGFAMNLVLTAWISCELIKLASATNSRLGVPSTFKFGLWLLLLPLCGGSGLIMLPPLLLWLVYSMSGSDVGDADYASTKLARLIRLGLLVACLVVITLYVWDYKRPVHHPLPGSFAAVGSTLLGYFSLVVCPNLLDYWQFAGWIAVLLVAATLTRLVWVASRQPDERHRAIAIVTVILAMLCAAAAVAVARAFSGAGGGRASRYITTTAPLFCAIYVAWLVYGSARARHLVHSVLLALIIVAIPANIQYGRDYGNEIGGVFTNVLRAMNTRCPISVAVKKAWPVLHPDQKTIGESFKLLKEARVGQFGKLAHDNLAAFPNPATVLR
jgi:hypothetical protein